MDAPCTPTSGQTNVWSGPPSEVGLEAEEEYECQETEDEDDTESDILAGPTLGESGREQQQQLHLQQRVTDTKSSLDCAIS